MSALKKGKKVCNASHTGAQAAWQWQSQISKTPLDVVPELLRRTTEMPSHLHFLLRQSPLRMFPCPPTQKKPKTKQQQKKTFPLFFKNSSHFLGAATSHSPCTHTLLHHFFCTRMMLWEAGEENQLQDILELNPCLLPWCRIFF